jgi:nucleotide-binding universal stress UspA family protein
MTNRRYARERNTTEPPMIKTILVPATGYETDLANFSAALRIARMFGAHLDVLHVRLDTIEAAVAMTADAGGGGALTPGLINQLEEEVREGEARAQHLFTEFCARESLDIATDPAGGTTKPSAQWHVETGLEPRWIAAYGMTADLIVASRSTSDDSGVRSILEAVLLETGRPLFIPGVSAASASLSDKIAIAWKPTPQAARAVALAMPFLDRAKEMVVMTVEEEPGRRDDADRLVQSLAWHGFSATAQRLTPGPHGVAETLLAAASSAKAGLLVLGGYGHSRLREWVFGGFTQRVLTEAPLLALIAH